MELSNYIKNINKYNANQKNSHFLDDIRNYNHNIINALNSIDNIKNKSLLDVGASPHGYALEQALGLGVKEYVGIGLDITDEVTVRSDYGTGQLRFMNAEKLNFHAERFDQIVTMSTFEHISDLKKCLEEFWRVLKKDGCVLITFEPIWTCSYGHHLHHLGNAAKLVPDWMHLVWSKKEMRDYLQENWTPDVEVSIEEICDWIYDSKALNRKSISEITEIIKSSLLKTEWIVPMYDIERNKEVIAAMMKKTELSKEELMTKGLSIFMRK